MLKKYLKSNLNNKNPSTAPWFSTKINFLTVDSGTRFMQYDVRNNKISLYKLLINSSFWIKL